MEKDKLQFKKRAAGHGPFVVGSYGPGDKICTDIEVGNQVSLETDDDLTVLARITEITGDQYTGVIESFENYEEEIYEGYRHGESIDFHYDEIQGCIR